MKSNLLIMLVFVASSIVGFAEASDTDKLGDTIDIMDSRFQAYASCERYVKDTKYIKPSEIKFALELCKLGADYMTDQMVDIVNDR